MTLKYFSVISFLFLAACGSGGGVSVGTDSLNAQLTSFSAIADPKIENFITFDVLGGVFSFKASEVEAAIFSDQQNVNKGLSVGKLSENLVQPGLQTSAATLSAPETIDASFSFSGKGGHGGLILIATGTNEKIYPSSTAAQPTLYRYKPLTLRFRFTNFAYDNACLGLVRLNGEITCTIEGDYTLSDKKFVGKALCSNGPADQPATLLYIAPNANYTVGLKATLTINGDPFSFDSYKYEGDITIDGASKKVEDLIGDGLTCTQ